MKKSLFFLAITSMLLKPVFSEGFNPDTALVVAEINEYWNGSNWGWLVKTIKGYDDLKRKIYEDIIPNMDDPTVKYLWNYDENGIFTEQVYLISPYAETTEWKINGKEILCHHSDIDTLTVYSQSDSGFVKIFSQITRYNNLKLPETVTKYKWNGSKWINYTHKTFDYDEYGNQISYEQSDWNNSEWQNNYREESDYNENQKITRKESFRWDVNTLQWTVINKSIFSYEYYGTHNIMIKVNYDNFNDSLVISSKELDSSDIENNLIEKVFYNWSEDSWQLDRRHYNVYDFMGNLRFVNYQQLDENGKWYTAERNRYEYAYYNGTGVKKNNHIVTNKEIRLKRGTNCLKITGIKHYGGNLKCEMFDLKGRVILSKMLKQDKSGTVSVNLEKPLYSGHFFIRLTNSNRSKVIYKNKAVVFN